jgi:uncharacterized membrane protein YcaP (DUF421 family)
VVESFASRLGATPAEIAVVVISGVLIYAAVILATRIVGLRSFSKMSAFDFGMTVAIGSLIATVVTGNAGLVAGLAGVATLYGAQFTLSWLRRRTDVVGFIDNRPLLLMNGPQVLDDHLDHARITREDLRGRLRQANVLDLSEVRAVVLETTGDISVLHGEGRLDPSLLDGVVGVDLLRD